MASFEPAFLPIGTDVSAKYRGAFCEAKVKKLVKSVKCKIILKDTQLSVVVTDENITGSLKVGSTVEVKLPDSGQQAEGVINKITDCSTYTVVFDDGDERTLRRTQLCLKGEKHFMESETLDNLPLSHPEHFGTPVLQNKKSRRTKPGEESESEEEMSSSEEETPRRASYKGRYQELVGKVMCMECTDKRKGGQCPVLVVLPDAHPMDVKPRDQLLVRSFRDAKFMYASRKELKEFLREIAIKNEDKNMKAAFEKALLYYDNHELPPNWKKQELLGSEDEDEGGDDDSSDDNEPSEQKDLFVAQLYKFMDDRSTPINKGPCIGNKDLNLYRLFRVVQAIGGYNKVTNQMKWRLVYSKMGLPPSNTASHQIKNAYKKYLHAFEDFYRKLGSTMGTISRPGRSRQSSSRSILTFRGRDKEPSPRSPRTEKTTVKDDKSKDEEKEKPKIKSEEGPRSEDTEDAGESTPVDESDTDIIRRSTPRREKAQKEEPAKIDKEKKEDVKIKREDKKEEEKKEEKKDEKKEDVKEEKKKEDKREERKSLRQSLKEEERKEAGKGKEEDKKDVKKSEGRTDRVLRREREDKEDEGKKEGEEQKDNQKKRVTRRKSGRTEDDKKEGDDKEEKEEEKKVSEEKTNADKKDKAEDKKERKDELKRPPSVRKEKKTEIKKKPEDEEQPEKKDKDSEKPEEVESEADSAGDNHNQDEYPAGTKLKVKYGRGRNQKIYEAKVVEAGKEGQHKNYLVHYAGWNTRYDEWVRPDRIVSVVDRPEMTKLKKKSMSPRSPKTTTKPDMPVLKKRGRNSLQQDQSPGNASAKMPASSDGKTPKSKPPTTPGGSASKTRTTRSNSTEIKSEGLQAPAKNRITRRSSGLTDSMDAGSPGDQDVGSDSEPESEMAAPSGSGGDLVSERDDEDEAKEMELDTSIEEEETSDMKEVEDEPITSVEEADMDESRSEEPLAEEASEDNKAMPHIVPKDENQENLLELSSLVPPDDSSITPLLANEENNDVTEGTKEDTTSLPEITKTSLEQQGTEESDEKLDETLPVLSQQTEEESVAKEVDTSNSSETPELDTKSETLPLADNSDEDKNSSYEELAIPQLKKIDIDIVPVSEKREAKLDKVKSKKKDGKESKKGRQTEHRASFSEIPTLEPMTVVPDVKPCQSEVAPSPYDFNEPELDLPWQPEITKKWEPINKPHPVFRDVKMEFKKNMETEKKKVKKKTKKAPSGDGDGNKAEKSPSKEASEKVESPAKDETASEPQQDKPVKKKGRKKKELSPDLKKEIQTYEDVVNSVVESYTSPEPEHVPFSPCAEKEEKPVKKRKNKSAENAESPSKMDGTKDTTESEKKQQGKAPKKIKGGKVVKKLNKKAKEGNSLEEGDCQPSDPAPLSFFPLAGQESVHSGNTPREKRARSHSPESSSFKQPRWDLGSLQTVSSTSASPLGSPAPKPASSSVVLPKPASNIATPRAGSSTSATAVGLEEVQVVPEEGPANVLSGTGLEARLECAVNLPRQGAAVANTVLDNTPPTTPENDLDEVHSASSDSHDNLKDDMESLDSGERTSKGGSESPPGCDLSVSSASNEALPSSKCVPQSSKGSELETSVKRKRTIDECALVKKKKRTNSARSTRAERHRKSPKYGDEDTLSRSSMDQISVSEQLVSGPVSPSKTENSKVDHIRPPKFHFCDDLGEHLEGEQRINFLMSKMIEIRKEYARIKAEIAAIDRRRKRHRRKEKESSQASQSEMERETS